MRFGAAGLALLALLLPALVGGGPHAQERVRVACLGDSITFGALLPDREHLAYPAQLGARLGADFEVRNFGAGGRTMLRAADLPYTASAEWKAALAWRPQVAVVILGTNDTVQGSRGNWEHAADLERDTRALVEELRAGGVERLLLCTPPPMLHEAPGLASERRADLAERSPRLAHVRSVYATVARAYDSVELHDLARVLRARDVSDGVHPNPFGAERIAARIQDALERPPLRALDIEKRRRALDGHAATASEFEGFTRLDLQLFRGEASCSILRPHAEVADAGGKRPWVLRARLDDLTATDLDLLDRGWHVVASEAASPDHPEGSRLEVLMRTLGFADEPAVGHPSLREALAAGGFERNPAVRAAPSAEYRAGAGWGENTWHGEVAAMRALVQANPDLPIAFFGDSITQGLTGTADRIARADGARAIDRAFGEPGAVSLGLSGDRTEHLLWRIEHGALALFDPKVIVLQIGVNNVNAAGHSGAETAAGIAAVVERLLEREPQAQIVVCGPFPAGATTESPVREALRSAAQGWRAQRGRARGLDGHARVHALDLWPLFLNAEGAPNERMRSDHIHVAPGGYDAWMGALAPVVTALL